MERDRYHHNHLKRALIESGIELLAREGVQAFSLRKLAAACGVSHAAPYKHFRNKEELLSAITSHVKAQFVLALRQTLAALPDAAPDARLIALGKQYARFMLEHPAYFQVLFFQNLPSGDVRVTREDVLSPREDSPFSLFRDTALNYLRTTEETAERYGLDLVALWSVVHGLTVLLVHQNLALEEEPLELVENVLTACLHSKT